MYQDEAFEQVLNKILRLESSKTRVSFELQVLSIQNLESDLKWSQETSIPQSDSFGKCLHICFPALVTELVAKI